jgi:hypothetical protein
VRRRSGGWSLLDVLITLALLGLLYYVVRLDWPALPRPAAPAAPPAQQQP